MTKPSQLALDVTLRPIPGQGEVIVGEANAQAVAALDRWPDWPMCKLAIVGPPGSRKSHLAAHWQKRSDARVLDARDIAASDLESAMGGTALIVENAEAAAGVEECEEKLFHIFNAVTAAKSSLLITGQTPPSRWNIALADLASRLQTVEVQHIRLPDDGLLRELLNRHFDLRGVVVSETVVNHMLLRMERSFGAVNQLVSKLDQLALARQKRINRDMVNLCLEEMSLSDVNKET
jgi:chromosomal replication initiation ATPase DnaA